MLKCFILKRNSGLVRLETFNFRTSKCQPAFHKDVKVARTLLILCPNSSQQVWQTTAACMQVFAAICAKSHLSCNRKNGVDYVVRRERARERVREREGERVRERALRIPWSSPHRTSVGHRQATVLNWEVFAKGFCLKINHLHVDCVGY